MTRALAAADHRYPAVLLHGMHDLAPHKITARPGADDDAIADLGSAWPFNDKRYAATRMVVQPPLAAASPLAVGLPDQQLPPPNTVAWLAASILS